jgi:hypothetical protein
MPRLHLLEPIFPQGFEFFPLDTRLATIVKFPHKPGVSFLQAKIVFCEFKSGVLANEVD